MGQAAFIDVEKKGNIMILTLHGRLDAISSPSLEKEVFCHIQEGDEKMIFDLSHVEFLSSPGMRMLLSTAKKLRTEGGKLIIASVPGPIYDMIKLSGFLHVLTIAPNVEEGMGMMRSGS